MSYRKQLALHLVGSVILGFLLGVLLLLLTLPWYVNLGICFTSGVVLTAIAPVDENRMQKP